MSVTPYFVQQVDYSNVNWANPSIAQLTKDVAVKGLHSHNDYWRKVPLLSSLLHGVQSVEADLWVFPKSFSANKTKTPSTGSPEDSVQEFKEGTIYVGHDLNYLNASQTLEALYLDPLFDLLQQANPDFGENNADLKTYPHGVFFGASSSTLYLLLDTKLDANATYELVKPALQRFIDNDYLSFYNETAHKWETGPLTIVLTGNLPNELVKSEETRYASLDGHLNWFNSSAKAETLQEEAKYSVIASTSFSTLFGGSGYQNRHFNDSEVSILKSTIDSAHTYGLKTRIWEHVNWPVRIRDAQNDELTALGSDFLNIDDLSIAYTY